ncbi:MAG: hypothetical protein PW734_01655 [Verrucomicrobium sp.]|nr:hypothetical protein [Verrucomicrobium sp.]
MLAPLDAIRSRGWTTREELLRIGFGGPVPGIAPDPDPCPIPLAINKIAPVRRPNGTEVLGGAAHVRVMPYGKERNLVTRLSALGPLGPLLTYSQENPSLIGHEAVHILQAHDIEITNLVAPHRRAPHVGASLHQGCGPLDPILASEETPLETWRRRRMLRGGVDNARLRLPHLAQAQPYYFKGIEVEARLAQLVFSLAQEEGWTRLPQSRAEAAPLFDRLRPGNAAARLPADPISLQAAEELRDEVAARLSPAQREAFFSQALPAFYADFLERCGDGQAREKMGLSPGIPQGRRAAERMIYEGTLAPRRFPRWTGDQWRQAAALAEPETLPGLVSLAVETEHRTALAPVLDAYRQRPEFSPDALRTLPIRFGERLLSAESRSLLREARRSAPATPAAAAGRTR